jgi:UDP-N-acetyl-D-galactosamine dehydrogenase
VDVYDPQADSNEVKEELGLYLIDRLEKKYNAIVLTVAHKDFLDMELRSYLTEGGIIYDVKGVLNINEVDARL